MNIDLLIKRLDASRPPTAEAWDEMDLELSPTEYWMERVIGDGSDVARSVAELLTKRRATPRALHQAARSWDRAWRHFRYDLYFRSGVKWKSSRYAGGVRDKKKRKAERQARRRQRQVK